MRAPLTLSALLTLVVLSACGEPEPQGMKVTVNGQTIDLGAMQEAGKRAEALAARALTPADVEKFIAVMPEFKRLSRQNQDPAKFLETHGVQIVEWGPLVSRVMAAYAALKHPTGAPVDEKTKTDAAVVRPFLDRVEAVINAK